MLDRERRERMHGWVHGPGHFPAREFTDWMWIGFAQALVWLLVVATAILLVAWLFRRISRERAPVTTNRARHPGQALCAG
jgi:hypothetical protein